MFQVLIVEPDFNLRTILKLNILKTLGCDVVEKETSIEAVEYLEMYPDTAIVFCESLLNQDFIANSLSEYLNNKRRQTPLIIKGSFSNRYKFTYNIDPEADWSEIVFKIGEFLGLEVSLEDIRLNDQFMPVSSRVFLSIDSSMLKSDIFIRIKKGDHYHFIKRLYVGEDFERLDIERYIKGGLKDFYVAREHFPVLVNEVTNVMILKLQDKDLKNEKRMQLTNDAYAITQERILSMGVDAGTKALVDESLKSMTKSVADKNAMTDFFKLLTSDQLSYSYSHTYLCCLLLHKVVVNFDWDSVAVKEKLTCMAYFHDMSLKDQRLVKINSQKELNESGLTGLEKEQVLHHAQESAKILETYPELPNGIGGMIREHHGAKSGIGFPESLSIAITPIAMMFMVVEAFVDKYLKTPAPVSNEQLAAIFIQLEKTYTKVTYLHTVKALKDVVLPKK